jgi:hypothetical protein
MGGLELIGVYFAWVGIGVFYFVGGDSYCTKFTYIFVFGVGFWEGNKSAFFVDGGIYTYSILLTTLLLLVACSRCIVSRITT